MSVGNKVRFGLSKVYYATITVEDGSASYAKPVAIPGAVNLVLDAQSALTQFYADNELYFEHDQNQGYSGSLEIALLPETFRTDVLGETKDANGAYIENVKAQIKPFALLFEFDGDVSATRHVLYNVHASRPNLSSTTKGAQVEVQTETLNIRVVPAEDTGNVKGRVPADASAYADFFDAVYVTPADETPADETPADES